MSETSQLQELGFIGDAQSHKLSTLVPSRTLHEWQALFPPSTITGSLGAVSLEDEVDGLALQRLIDIMAPSGRVLITLPACFALLSRALRTNGPASVSIRGAGGEVSTLRFQDNKTNGFEHGKIQAGGTFCVADVNLRAASDGYAFDVVSAGDPSVILTNCLIFGFAGGLRGHNIRSSQFQGNIWSTLGSPSKNALNCYELTQSSPAMQNIFCDKQILGFHTAYHWTISSQIGFEGQYVSGVQINECVSAFRVDNPIYKTIDWKFHDLEIEVQGQVAHFENMRGVDYYNQYIITLGEEPVPVAWSFANVDNLLVSGIRPQIFKPIAKVFSFTKTNGTRFRDNNINDQHSAAGICLFLGEGNVDFVETGTQLNVFTGVSIAGDTRGLSLEYIAFTVGGTVDRQGRYTVSGQVTGTTDTNGILRVSLPKRPDGSPLFSVPPLHLITAGDRNFGGTDTFGPVRPGDAQTLEIVVYDPATGNPRVGWTRQLNYVLIGA